MSSEVSPKQFTHQLKVLQRTIGKPWCMVVENKSSLSFLEGKILKWLSLLGAVKN
jgi:hypothetical protein